MTWVGNYNEAEQKMVEMSGKEFMEKLHKEFPNIIKEVYSSIGVGPGWHPILYDILKKVNYLLQETKDGNFKIAQIKEKYGTLRFYFDVDEMKSETLYDIISIIVHEGEAQSEYHCEDCGSTKDVATKKIDTNSSWIRTLCKECREKINER